MRRTGSGGVVKKTISFVSITKEGWRWRRRLVVVEGGRAAMAANTEVSIEAACARALCVFRYQYSDPIRSWQIALRVQQLVV